MRAHDMESKKDECGGQDDDDDDDARWRANDMKTREVVLQKRKKK
jgi:hypothetical protein